MPHDTFVRGYPEPEVVATYNFWGFYLKMTELCTVYKAEQKIARGRVAISIFRNRKLLGILRHYGDEIHCIASAADLPVELWDEVERWYRRRCIEEVARDDDHSTCCRGVALAARHEDFYKSWCSLCYPIRPNESPENPLNEDLRSCERTPDILKRDFCNCLVCDQDPIVHRPGLSCPTERFADFNRHILAPFGLRIVCAISDVDEHVDELYGVTLSRFPEIDLGLEAALRALEMSMASNDSDADGSDGASSISRLDLPPATPVVRSGSSSSSSSSGVSDPNLRLTARQLKTIERPFRRLLREYSYLKPFYLDPKESPSDPEVFCEYHTPLVPSYWSSVSGGDVGSDGVSDWEGQEGWEGFMPGTDDENPNLGHDDEGVSVDGAEQEDEEMGWGEPTADSPPSLMPSPFGPHE